jgi:ribosomal protein S12 methylthiotransferase accessory factor
LIRTDLRSRPPEDWQRRIAVIAAAAGVTRIGDVTGFDRIGVPVFQAVRPMSRSLSVSQGKGWHRPQARLSALMEALELHCGERCRPADRRGSLRALGPHWGRAGSDLDPYRDWLVATDLAGGGSCLVPRERICLDMTGPVPDLAVCSDGMGAGATIDEATLAGLCEVIEREAHARWQALSRRERAATAIDPASVADGDAAALLNLIARAGCRVHLWEIGGEIGVAAFLCVIAEGSLAEARAMAPAGGTGCHPDRGVAIGRAILEAAQTRVTARVGAREDFKAIHYDEARRLDRALLLELIAAGPPQRDFTAAPSRRFGSAGAAIDGLLDRIMPLGGPVARIDLTDPTIGIPVVRIIAPWQQAPELMLQPTSTPVVAAEPGALTGRRLLFVGPSAPGLLASPPAGFLARPPARCGDIASAIAEQPAAIGLIDGVFGTGPAVWHKEILFAIEAGIPVYGAGSIGALRAAELSSCGMIGVGGVFAAYAAGRMARDDAVLVEHAPAELGCRPLTVALVDMLATLAACPIPPTLRRRLATVAASLPVAERRWPAVLEAASIGPEERPALLALLDGAATSVKEADAMAMVTAMAGPLPDVGATPRPPVPRTRFVAVVSRALPA